LDHDPEDTKWWDDRHGLERGRKKIWRKNQKECMRQNDQWSCERPRPGKQCVWDLRTTTQIVGEIGIMQPDEKRGTYSKREMRRSACSMLGKKGHLRPKCWTVDDLACDYKYKQVRIPYLNGYTYVMRKFPDKCLKWGEHCYAGKMQIPSGIQVTGFQLHGHWPKNACSGQDGSVWTHQYTREGTFEFWKNFPGKRFCAFLVERRPGYHCPWLPPQRAAPLASAIKTKEGYCLDVHGGGNKLEKGQELGLWSCHYRKNQKFLWESARGGHGLNVFWRDKALGYIKLSEDTSLCIHNGDRHLDGEKRDVAIRIGPCNVSGAQWTYLENGMLRQFWGDNRCLATNGRKVQLKNCGEEGTTDIDFVHPP